jgi:hypothetical protein
VIEPVLALNEVVVAKLLAAPDNGTCCGDCAALLVICSTALLDPTPVGENATVIWQVLFGGRIMPLQLSVKIVKSPALVPAMLTEMFASGAAPVLARVADAIDVVCIN